MVRWNSGAGSPEDENRLPYTYHGRRISNPVYLTPRTIDDFFNLLGKQNFQGGSGVPGFEYPSDSSFSPPWIEEDSDGLPRAPWMRKVESLKTNGAAYVAWLMAAIAFMAGVVVAANAEYAVQSGRRQGVHVAPEDPSPPLPHHVVDQFPEQPIQGDR